MGGRQDKKARKILREELRAKLAEEKAEIMPQVKVLKEAVLNLKPCFEIFGLTFFKTKDVVTFYDTLKEWVGEKPHRVARKKFWQVFSKLTTPPPVVDKSEPTEEKEVMENVSRATIPHKVEMP